MTVHGVRGWLTALRRAQPKQDPIRYARGVVVSSTIGQTVVILDNNGIQVPAFNYTHTQSLAAGTVVRVVVIDQKIEIVGAYPG